MTHSRRLPSWWVLMILWLTVPAWAHGGPAVVDVSAHGAKGDGKTLDTDALNRAVEACAAGGRGEVRVPAGRYLTGTVHLKSGVTLVLDDGAVLVGTPDLDQYQGFTPPENRAGSESRWHRALILGVGVENVAIMGRGTIDGGKVFDAQGEEHMRGPHAVLFGDSRNITLRDVSIRDAGNYAVMLELTSQVEVRGVKITGGWDGVHFRGRKGRPCREVHVTDCEFYTGDDCIAGGYWEDVLIDRCVINSSCNGVRLIAPATRLTIHDCLFFGPGRFEHRTSREKHRRNMLAGLCLQPGAWMATEGALDDVTISDISMHDVSTPVHVALTPGNTAGRIWVDRLSATRAYFTAMSLESWAGPIERVCLRDVSVEFTGGNDTPSNRPAVLAPGVDVRPLPAWGLYAHNIKTLQLEGVRLGVSKPDVRPAVIAESVGTIEADSLRYPRSGAEPLAFVEVSEVRSSDGSIPVTSARCVDLSVAAVPLSATATVENAGPEGLARVEVTVDGQPAVRWVWLKAGERKPVMFAKLPTMSDERHELRCGELVREVPSRKP